MQLPQLLRIAGSVRIEGLAVEPQGRYFEFSGAAPAGRVWQNLDFEQYALSSGLRLQPVLLQQTSELDDGLLVIAGGEFVGDTYFHISILIA
jgi:surfeit locus 1 family protein